jgi:hypothetical protein
LSREIQVGRGGIDGLLAGSDEGGGAKRGSRVKDWLKRGGRGKRVGRGLEKGGAGERGLDLEEEGKMKA